MQVEAFGRSNAAIKVGGYVPAMSDSVENWNGTSWTEVAEINSATVGHGAFGISTSGAIAGGSPTPNDTRHESWNGTSWTETTEISTGRSYLGSGGASSSSGMILLVQNLRLLKVQKQKYGMVLLGQKAVILDKQQVRGEVILNQ